jgi:hypothetical protein
MKALQFITVFSGVLVLALGLGFAFQLPIATAAWPWPDGRLSYLFIGSILAAVSAAMIWVGWTGEWGALPAGSLNVFVIAVLGSAYFTYLLAGGRAELLPFVIAGILSIFASAAAFFWSRNMPLRDQRPTPLLVRISFGIFLAALVLAGGALLLRLPVFPWAVKPDSSVIFGSIFIGDACYFLYGLLKPRWHNAQGQLLSFLAYDLVLIVPFIQLFGTVKPELMLNLTVYVAVLIYSSAIAVYFLLIQPQTRMINPRS